MQQILQHMAFLEWETQESPDHTMYGGVADLLLDQGVDMVSSSVDALQRQYLNQIARQTNTTLPHKRTYCGTQMFVVASQSRRLSYWEGYISVEDSLPKAHAWICLDGLHVVDITKPLCGELPEGWVYRGVRIPTDAVFRALLRYGTARPYLQTPDLFKEHVKHLERKTRKPWTKELSEWAT